MGSPWYESNVFWSPACLAVGLIVTVVALVKQDLRWLLFFAWPLFTLALWWATRQLNPRHAAWLILAGGSLVVAGALDWLNTWLVPRNQHAASPATPSQAIPVTPTPHANAFTEKTGGKFIVEAGGVTLDVNYPTTPQPSGFRPCLFQYKGPRGVTPLRLFLENGKVVPEAEIAGDNAGRLVEIKGYDFVDRTPLGWDRNFKDDVAIEFVNDKGIPQFQMIHLTPNKLQINGVFAAGQQGPELILQPGVTYTRIHNPPPPPLKPIFKYPSWKYRGVLAD